MSQRILELGIGMRMKQGDYCLLRGFMIQLALEIHMRDQFDVKTLLELKIPGTSFKSNLLTCGSGRSDRIGSRLLACSFGQTGSHFWGFEAHGIVPDTVTMAKVKKLYTRGKIKSNSR
ncbi:alanine--glyoxylate aminotransferase protein 3, mitochondrial [Trifolium repens]|nr:alanine--glyoxylate aminotransferase protein 3, mitochondrial [Trifolium repens]